MSLTNRENVFRRRDRRVLFSKRSQSSKLVPTPEGTEETCETLKQQLAARTNELQLCREQLEKRDSELSQFLSRVSHDLNAPLRAIAGFSNFLQEEYQNRIDDTANGYIERIVQGVDRMRDLISGLSELSRVETQAASFKVTDLNELLSQALKLLHDSIQTSHAIVTWDPLPKVAVDPTQLRQLLTHLIENAIKFCDTIPPRIHVTVERCENEVTISVSDNGIGIDAADGEKIFEVFQRLQHKRAVGGVGIGLAVSRRIVERHSGRIWFNSDKQTGSLFCFTIPLPSS